MSASASASWWAYVFRVLQLSVGDACSHMQEGPWILVCSSLQAVPVQAILILGYKGRRFVLVLMSGVLSPQSGLLEMLETKPLSHFICFVLTSKTRHANSRLPHEILGTDILKF